MAVVSLINSPTPADPEFGTSGSISLHPGQHQPPPQMLQAWHPQWSSCSVTLRPFCWSLQCLGPDVPSQLWVGGSGGAYEWVA